MTRDYRGYFVNVSRSKKVTSFGSINSEVFAVIQKNWQALIKPTNLEVLPGGEPGLKATVVAEPLERLRTNAWKWTPTDTFVIAPRRCSDSYSNRWHFA